MPPASPGARVNRNDPCPCGSGKKYKKCCMGRSGRPAAAAQGLVREDLIETAIRHHRAGRVDEAHEYYRRVLESRPRNAVALAGLGQIRGMLGHLEDGIDYLRQAIAVDDRRADFQLALADLALRDSRFDEAQAAARRALSLEPDSPGAGHMVALCLQRAHRLDEAAIEARKVLAIDPDNVSVHVLMGTIETQQGALAAARTRLEALLTKPMSHDLRYQALKQLGLVLDRLGSYDAAFEMLTEAGLACAETPVAQRTDRDHALRLIDSCVSAMTGELLDRWKPDSFEDGLPTPCFLIGFPRSGTTLTEQILAAHPDVVTTGERRLIGDVHEALAGMFSEDRNLPAMLSELDADDIVKLRATYWQKAERITGPAAADNLLVDKMPLNIIEIGLINVIFPDAKVILIQRDPRDVCLSCFTQSFGITETMINFLWWDRTAEFYAKVMNFWLKVRELITLPYLELRYEDLVEDLEGQSRRMLDFLELSWDDGVLRYHEQSRKRYISTPSYTTATKPISTRSIGRWRCYDRQFQSVAETLQPLVEAFGYE